jgi:hypothetical protein
MRHSATRSAMRRRPGGRSSYALAMTLLLVIGASMAACSRAREDGDPSAGTPASLAPAPAGTPDHALATFEVEGGERFEVELVGTDLVANAQALLAGDDVPSIPVGTVVRDDPGPNVPWHWHLDPATVTFADATIDGCDGDPSDVEAADDGSLARYCPWSATVVAVDALP